MRALLLPLAVAGILIGSAADARDLDSTPFASDAVVLESSIPLSRESAAAPFHAESEAISLRIDAAAVAFETGGATQTADVFTDAATAAQAAADYAAAQAKAAADYATAQAKAAAAAVAAKTNQVGTVLSNGVDGAKQIYQTCANGTGLQCTGAVVGGAMDAISGDEKILGPNNTTPTLTPRQIMDEYHKTCWLCGFARNFILVSNTFSSKVYDTWISQNLAGLIQILFVFWLTLRAIQMILGIGPNAAGKGALWGIAKKSLLAMILVLGLQQGTFWTELYQFPLTSAIGISDAMIANAPLPFGTTGTSTDVLNIPIPPAIAPVLDSVGSIVNKVETMHFFGVAIGASIIGNSFDNVGILNSLLITPIIKAMIQALTGLFLCCIFMMGSIYYVFFIIDHFIRIAIVCAFAPIFIVLYFLEQTRGFATAALGFLVGSWAVLAMSGFAYMACGAVIQAAITSFGDGSLTTIDQVFDAMAKSQDFVLPNTPFFWLMTLAGLSLPHILKKVVRLSDGIFGHGDSNLMANQFNKAANTAVAATGAVAAGAVILAGGAAAAGAGMAAGAGAKGGMAIMKGSARAAGRVGSLMKNASLHGRGEGGEEEG